MDGHELTLMRDWQFDFHISLISYTKYNILIFYEVLHFSDNIQTGNKNTE